MKKLLLITLMLFAPVALAQIYTENYGNWEVQWRIDEFSDRITYIQVNSKERIREVYNMPAIGIDCNEENASTGLLYRGNTNSLRSDERKSFLFRVDNSQPFTLNTSSTGRMSTITGTPLREVINRMKAGRERIAIRTDVTTFTVSLEGFNQAYERFAELSRRSSLCPV